MLPRQHLEVLDIISKTLKTTGIAWAVVGSTSLALQGVKVDAHDIDLLTTKEGAIEMGRLFKQYETQPVKYSESDTFRSYHGVLSVKGIQVEIMGDLEHKAADGRWLEGSRWTQDGKFTHLITYSRDGITLPLLELKAEYSAYVSMGRLEKAALIKEVLDRSKPKI
jgi:hypothetical protein